MSDSGRMWFAAKISRKVVLSMVPSRSPEAELALKGAMAALVGAKKVSGCALEVLLRVVMREVFANGPLRRE